MMKSGIVIGHAFTILKAFTIKRNGKTVRLLRMRNPWSKETYTGPYSDKDSVWKDKSITDQMGRSKAYKYDNGIFYMPVSQFLIDFKALSINHHKDTHVHSQVESKNDNSSY
jgi:hypothetical protein